MVDKIERNLFERNCDVQAWATFGKIVLAAQDPTPENCDSASALLANLVRIYEVYHDILLLDKNGNIIASGANTYSKENYSSKEWFSIPLKTESVYVSDMHKSKNLNDYTISYACPVFSSTNELLGVICTKFNSSQGTTKEHDIEHQHESLKKTLRKQ